MSAFFLFFQARAMFCVKHMPAATSVHVSVRSVTSYIFRFHIKMGRSHDIQIFFSILLMRGTLHNALCLRVHTCPSVCRWVGRRYGECRTMANEYMLQNFVGSRGVLVYTQLLDAIVKYQSNYTDSYRISSILHSIGTVTRISATLATRGRNWNRLTSFFCERGPPFYLITYHSFYELNGER